MWKRVRIISLRFLKLLIYLCFEKSRPLQLLDEQGAHSFKQCFFFSVNAWEPCSHSPSSQTLFIGVFYTGFYIHGYATRTCSGGSRGEIWPWPPFSLVIDFGSPQRRNKREILGNLDCCGSPSRMSGSTSSNVIMRSRTSKALVIRY